ncbi:MAG TPA: hypothetical protein VIK18_18495 [Pirellulales bacterium]
MAWLLLACFAAGGRADVELPKPNENETISFGATTTHRWNQGAYEVWLLEGKCFVKQGEMNARSNEAVLWIKRSGNFANLQNTVTAYFEGDVHVDYQRAGFPYQLTDSTWLGEFYSIVPLSAQATNPQGEPPVKPPVYVHALARRDPYANRALHRTQFGQFDGGVQQADPVPDGTRRLRAFPRSAVQVQAQWFPNAAGDEWIAVINSGVNLIIDGLPNVGSIDIATDRMVIWTKSKAEPDLSGQTLQGQETPLEIYMEGNIVFRQGERVIHAERMYYDVNNQVGTVLQANILTPVPSYRGLLRLRADIVRQTGPDRFFAHDTFITSSRMENPGYRMQAKDVYFEDIQRPVVNALTGAPEINPVTGEQVIAHEQLATSRNNFLFLGPVPVFYWPVLATDLSQPSYYIRKIGVQEDTIFGYQIRTAFDGYQLLGVKQKPEGTNFTLSADYFSLRGPAAGATYTWQRQDIFGIRGTASGFFDIFGVHDTGTDKLGGDRQGLIPETADRYRALLRHRQMLADNWRITAEFGKISDRHYLEQYFQSEWIQSKDETTDVELKRLVDNMSYSIRADVRLNPFFTQTQDYPRLDHYWLGQSLLGDRITWYEHTTGSYSQLQRFSAPTVNAVDVQKEIPLAWEVNAKGERFISVHEFDAPVQLGALKVTPYVMGEFGHWGQDIQLQDYNRLWGQVGMRMSIPFWSVNPNIDSELFNVHGIAHKIVLDADLSAADANRRLTDLPLYDQLNDNAQEDFQRRFATNTFGGTTPLQFDARLYALRFGLQNYVTNPSLEIADRLAALRFGARQRWQTKRGPPNNRRIIDWITLDSNATVFPNANRDDFGAVVGLVNYDFRWHVGDRLSVLSTGMYDFYANAEKITTIGAQLSRPPRGSLYAGFYALEGLNDTLFNYSPFPAYTFNTYYSYRLSPKWVSSVGASINLSGLGLVGNQLTLTRVGESFLTSFNFVYNKYLNNVGFNFMLEPRFVGRTRTGNVGGAMIPLAGVNGLE